MHLTFSPGAIYTLTYNKEGYFIQSQIAILLDLLSEYDLNNWRKINVLIYLPSIHNVEFDPEATKSSYIENGLKEVKGGVSRKNTDDR